MMNHSIAKHLVVSLAGALLIVIGGGSAFAQFGPLSGAADRLKRKVPDLLRGDAPVSTRLSDAKWGDESKDGFTPAESPRDLTTLQRTRAGGFVLEPGYFAAEVQSYCLMAGTYGPGDGDGYLYAPVKGAARDAVVGIVRGSTRHPEIEQEDVQALLWAVVARAKFENLAPRLKATASRLLTPAQLAALNRNALEVLSGNALTDALGGVPEPLRLVAEADAKLRQMVTSPGLQYEDMEEVAFLAGPAPIGQGSSPVPSGRWSIHPDGYYIRFTPAGYKTIRIEIWVPPGVASKEFDPATHIAVPGNTARQRLIASGRPQRQEQ
jgi:hypothetical protein